MRITKILAAALAFTLVGGITASAQTEGYTLDIRTAGGTSASIPVDNIREATIEEAPHCMLNVSASNGGYALGGRKVYKGQTVTITAIPEPGNTFRHWADKDASGNYITENPRTITITDVSATIDYNAVFDDATEYFYFEAVQPGTKVQFVLRSASDPTTLQYSTDKIEWTSISRGYNQATTVTLENEGDKVYWRTPESNSSIYGGGSNSNWSRFNVSAGEAHIGGNLLTLLDKKGTPATIGAHAFWRAFYNCKNLTAINADFKMPATAADYAFSDMFIGCSNLIDASALKIDMESVGNYAFDGMFQKCTALEKGPSSIKAAAMTGQYNFSNMFDGCAKLEEAPELPSDNLRPFCYYNMFQGCTSLTTAPELPAMTLGNSCYRGMFKSCTALTTAPELPATKLGQTVYNEMFMGCTALVNIPAELPATNLSSCNSCYESMFKGCTSLTAMPEIKATKMCYSACSEMFRGCSNLTTVHPLLTTTIDSYSGNCYASMFRDCTKLEEAPEIFVTGKMSSAPFVYMFNGCTKLRSLKVHFSEWPSTSYMNNWLTNAGSEATNPTFYLPTGTPAPTTRANNTVPESWTIVNF